jgi:alkaline phosphatase D
MIASGATGALRTSGASRGAAGDGIPYDALGELVGEVTDRSALVRARLTARPERNARGYSVPIYRHSLTLEESLAIRIPEGMAVADLEGACPGKAGLVRIRFGNDPGLARGRATEWVEVGPARDFSCRVRLEDLDADTTYHYAAEMRALSGAGTRQGVPGRFRTAPRPERWSDVRFAVVTCQDYACRDTLGGYRTYRALGRLGPSFLVHTGDNVYYDIDLPVATSVELARFHWHRIYSQSTVRELFHQTPGYWLKDDHDVFEDDCWPTRPPSRVAPMTYRDLAPVFTEQVPVGDVPYRRFRWGRGLEIWLLEGRDFRSPNPDPDGPAKTLWGAAQMAWLKETLRASDAAFRIVISPLCIVGPGGGPGRRVFQYPEGGADSHGDGGYGHEGRAFRAWVRDSRLRNLVVLCGDRHWQYHSVDPETSLHEFCSGPVCDLHAAKDAVEDRRYHRFFRAQGGFLSAAVAGSEGLPRLAIRLHDVDGAVVHEAAFGTSA